MKIVRLLFVVILALSVSVMLTAQEDDDNGDVDLSLYSDIPQSRADDGAFVLGDPDAPVTIIEFADYLCPHCQDYHATVGEFIDKYVVNGDAKIEYRFFPIIDQQLSPYIASITECAWDQEAFWPTYELMYKLARERAIGADILDVVVTTLELDADAMEECLLTANQFEEDLALGAELDVTGTPAIRVRVGDGPIGALVADGRSLTGGGVPFDVLVEFVESEDPEAMVTYELGPQLLNENLLSDDSVVTADPCGAPCWNNITPGETSWAAALEIIGSDEALANIETQESPQGNLAQWGVLDGVLCCQMFSDSAGELVDLMILQTAPVVSFGEVIDEYGEPTVLSGDLVTRSQAVVTVFYPDVPMLLYVYVEGADGEISADSEIIGVIYMTEVIYEGIIDGAPNLVEWDDFATFDDYFGEDDDSA